MGNIGFSYADVENIIVNSTVRDENSNSRYVPFGFVQSPIIATLTLHKSALGRFLKTQFLSREVKLSIYMDDIMLSSNSKKALEKSMGALLEISAVSNFPLNLEKLVAPTENLEIFNISVSHKDMRITDEKFQEFEESVIQNHSVEKVDGIVSYVLSVNIEQGKKLQLINAKTEA